MRVKSDMTSYKSTLQQPLVPENLHTVQFYEVDSDLLDTLAQSVCTAIMADNSAIVIATAAHHAGLFTRLKGHGIEVHAAILEARLFLLDAVEIVARLIVDGQPDPSLFAQDLGPNIAQLTANARGESPSVFIFGEIVALLWEQGRYDAALSIEQIGNQLLASCSANILCAYPARLFADPTHSRSVAEICALHSCVIPPHPNLSRATRPIPTPTPSEPN